MWSRLRAYLNPPGILTAGAVIVLAAVIVVAAVTVPSGTKTKVVHRPHTVLYDPSAPRPDPYGNQRSVRLPITEPTLCNQYDWKYVHWYQNWYVVRNDAFISHECLTNTDDGTNYVVSKSTANSTTSGNQAFPEIFSGCQWNICTPGTGLPVQWKNLKDVTATVHTLQDAPGLWNSAFDIWFGQQSHITGQAKGTELMIWLGTGDNSSGPVPIVTIDGWRWYVRHWRACHGVGNCWNYLMLWSVNNHIKRVTDLKLLPFFQYANTRGLGYTSDPRKPNPALWKDWWLWNVSFGNEIWTQGNGLGVSWFRLKGLPTKPFTPPHPPRPPKPPKPKPTKKPTPKPTPTKTVHSSDSSNSR